jgi:putative AdoMet-dependent methyltransferase
MVQKEKTWDFDQWAEDYDGWVSSEDPIYARYDVVLGRVVELSGAATGKRILEIGTGTGNLAGLLLSRGAEVAGLDPSRKMLDRAAMKLAGNQGLKLQHVHEPFLSLPFEANSFDAVVSTYAFHHVHPDKKTKCVCEMLRVLKPGGVWVIGDLMFQNADEEKEALDSHDWMEDEYYARIDELLHVLRDRGLVLKSEQYTMIAWVVWAEKPASGAKSV